MTIRSLLSFLLPLVLLLAIASPARAEDFTVKSARGEWIVENLSKRGNVTVTFEWTNLTFNRLEHATLVVPPQGQVRICPVNGNTQPEPVKKR